MVTFLTTYIYIYIYIYIQKTQTHTVNGKVDTGKNNSTLCNLVDYIFFFNISTNNIIDRLAVQAGICCEIEYFSSKI